MADDEDRQRASRRDFLIGAAGAAVGVGVLGAVSGAAGAAPTTTSTPGDASNRSRHGTHPPAHPKKPLHAHYHRGRFEDARGAKMTVVLASGPVVLTIQDVEPLDVADGEKTGSHLWHNAFRVHLVGPKGVDIPQGTHRVSINGRSFDLFVVPVVRHGDTPRYEAIVHRIYHRGAHA